MAEHPARRPPAAALFVVAVAAAGLNLRTAITSVPPLFPDLASQLRLSSAALSLLAATPVLCFGVVSAFAAWINRRFGEELVLLIALVVLAAGLLHTATGSWTIPMILLLSLAAVELGFGLLAARPVTLPGHRSATRVSGTGRPSRAI